MRKTTLVLSTLALTLGVDLFAMSLEPTRVVVWRRGETIGGEEFVAANEAVVDYIATLRRPTEMLKGIRYNCFAKTRLIRPSVRPTPPSSGNSTVDILSVYELKDCAEVAAP